MNGELFPDLATRNVLTFNGTHTKYGDVVNALAALEPGKLTALTIQFTGAAHRSLVADMVAMKAWPEDMARTSICGFPFVVGR